VATCPNPIGTALIDSTHKYGIAFSAGAAVVALAVWWWLDRSTPGELTGGSVAGLWYALLGSLLMLFAWLLSAVRHFLPQRLPPVPRGVHPARATALAGRRVCALRE
jgi:hypothetical protein